MTNKKLIQMPASSIGGKNTNLIKVLLLLGCIIVAGYFIYINYFAPPAGSNLELFTLQSDNYYGNLLTYETGLAPSYDSSSKPRLIKLPGRSKLTRFKINGPVLSKQTATGDSSFYYALEQNIDVNMTVAIPGIAGKFGFVSRDALNKAFPDRIDKAAGFTIDKSSKITKADATTPAANIKFWAHTEYIEPKFRVFIADNETEIYDVTKRTSIIFDNNTGCSLNTDYTDPALFESNNKAKYIGSVLLIEPLDSMNPIYITGYETYGLAPYSPGFDDYDTIPEITGTTKSADNTVITVSSSSKDYKVGYLELVDNKAAHTEFNIRIQYDNSYDGQKNKYTVDGPVQLGYSNSSKYIFIDEPFIAKNIYITPGYAGVVKVFGTLATKTDEKTFKLEQNKFDTKGMIVGGQKCPNMGQMMQKQLQAQQICEALEQKDRVRNKKLAYERDKVYLKKLGNQDAEIQDLTAKINTLINKKNERIKASAGLVDAKKLEAELAKVERLRKEAQDFMAKPNLEGKGLNLKVNLDPAFGELKRELANEL